VYKDVAAGTGIGQASQNSLGFGCLFFDVDLDGNLDLFAANGHIDETARNIRANATYAQAPHLFLSNGKGQFRDVAREVGDAFAAPKVARGAAYGDFDNDGDVDLLVTTNHGPTYLYRNDLMNGNRSLRLRLRGTKSNRDGIGAIARLTAADGTQSRMVKSGSSYLSQSELTLTFGLGKRDRAQRLVIEWPSGRVDEHGPLTAGAYECAEGSKPQPR
jgi:enediyne biosynthesis protein E4